MDFDLSQEHEAFRKAVRDFAERRDRPARRRWDERARLSARAVRAMGELGLFGLVFPEEWGGGDGDFASLCIAIEEIGRVDQSMGITLSAGVGLGANPIFRFGDDEQKATVAARPRRRPGARRVRPHRARRRQRRRRHPHPGRADGDDWVIDGTKAFITNSGTPITSIITVTARTDDGISTFVVEAGTPGLIVEPPYRKLGWHASDTHGLALDDCRVPDATCSASPGAGFRNFLSILDDGRIAISALALGCARACLDERVAYAKERHAFGGPIGATRPSRSRSPTWTSRSRTRATSPTRRRG